MKRVFARVILAALVLVLGACTKKAAPSSTITVATTTSTRDSGLLEMLLPRFKRESGIEVKIIAVGSGQALEIGRRGDADALLVHAPEAEERFMAEGNGAWRRPVMYNDFVVVGPKGDPAHVAGVTEASAAFKAIAAAHAAFVSRGDGSGTHLKEQEIWRAAEEEPKGDWYRSAGQGMSEVLRMANQMGAYALADRATYLAQRRNVELTVLLQKDPALVNPYSVIGVDPKKHPTVHADEARRFADFLLAPATQEAIAGFDIARDGEPSFFRNPK